MSVSKIDDFSLKSNSDVFNSRLNSVFDNLQSLEENHESWRKKQDPSDSKRLWKDEPEDTDSEKRPFKRPHISRVGKWKPLRSQYSLEKNEQSGFEQNPSQWVKYSLADVSDYDLSDKCNTKAALNFIEMRKRLRLQENPDSIDESISEKPVFRKPHKQSRKDDLSIEVVTNKPRGIMPECVVGSSKPRNIQRVSASRATGSGNSICLDHLNEGENSEDDDDLSDKVELDGFRSSLKFKSVKNRSLKPCSVEDIMDT